MRVVFLLLAMVFTVACTTHGKLEYVTESGEHKTACETEYSGAPSVDKYAVEYILSYCAKKAIKQGHQIIDKNLLNLDLSIPNSPNGKQWSFEYATKLHQSNQLTDKEYGYIIASIDLGLNTPNKQINKD